MSPLWDKSVCFCICRSALLWRKLSFKADVSCRLLNRSKLFDLCRRQAKTISCHEDEVWVEESSLERIFKGSNDKAFTHPCLC